jgi:ketosteroid isomerase-like protein
MSTEQNKKVAIDLFARFTASDIDGVLATLTDDATWLIPGKPDASPAAGLYTKDTISGLFHTMLKRLKTGLKMTVKSAIAEGDKVALEIESLGELTNGRVYNQHYHFLIEFRGGKIFAVREYLDTQHAHAVWFKRDDL